MSVQYQNDWKVNRQVALLPSIIVFCEDGYGIDIQFLIFRIVIQF